jgi:hypothetical protein
MFTLHDTLYKKKMYQTSIRHGYACVTYTIRIRIRCTTKRVSYFFICYWFTETLKIQASGNTIVVLLIFLRRNTQGTSGTRIKTITMGMPLITLHALTMMHADGSSSKPRWLELHMLPSKMNRIQIRLSITSHQNKNSCATNGWAIEDRYNLQVDLFTINQVPACHSEIVH